MAGVPEELRGAIWAEADIQFSECAMWEAGRAEAREKEPVVSDVPTLILTGEYDPVTPPRWGKLAAKTLSSSFVFEFPGTGHCTIDSYDCADDLVTQFLANPTVKPDATCLLDVPAPEFSMPDDEITISE